MSMKVPKLTQNLVGLCLDAYESPSTKDINRKNRCNEETERNFTFDPRQKSSDNSNNSLEISEFKTDFLMNEYKHPSYLHILGEKIFHSIENICNKFYFFDSCLKDEEVQDLYENHLEADTRVLFHTFHTDMTDPGNINTWE